MLVSALYISCLTLWPHARTHVMRSSVSNTPERRSKHTQYIVRREFASVEPTERSDQRATCTQSRDGMLGFRDDSNMQ